MCTVEKENILSVHLQNYANCADWVSKGILNIDSCLFSFVPSSSCQHLLTCEFSLELHIIFHVLGVPARNSHFQHISVWLIESESNYEGL